jgi:hypothetical protein
MASHSTTETRILPIYPSVPAGADLELFRLAKAELSLDYLIQPVRAVQGSPFRIIALRKAPDFICDYALVKQPNVASIREAMKWALGDSEDTRAITVVNMLEGIFGKPVTEL